MVFAVASFLALLLTDLGRLDGIRVSPHAVIGRDFVNVWTAGNLVWSRKLSLVYDIEGYRAFLTQLFSIRDIYAYSYPPSTLLLAAAFASLPYVAALAVWTGAGAALFYRAARPWFVDAGLPPALALLNPAGFACIWAGHYGLLVGGLALYGWRWLDARPRLAGVMFGLMTIKPHLGILIVLGLLLQGRWQAIASAALTFVLLFIVSGWAFGFGLWADYLFHTLGFHAALLMQGVAAFHGMMPTIASALLRLGAAPVLVDAAQCAGAAFAIVVVAVACRRKVATVDVGMIVGTATFLFLPYAFNYDMTVVSAGVLLFAARPKYDYTILDRAALTTAFILPLVLGPGRTYVVIGPAVLALLLVTQLKIATVTRPITVRRGVPAGAGAARSA